MSRAKLIVVLLLVIVVGGAILLSTLDTEVAPQPVEKAVANGVLAQ